MFKGMLMAAAAALCLTSLSAPAIAADAKPEIEKLSVALSGVPSQMHFLPIYLAIGLGYFEEQGLEVEPVAFAGGSKALQALIGGSVDLSATLLEHAIVTQAQDIELKCIALHLDSLGLAILIRKDRVADYKSPADLKDMVIGVSAVGNSGTHNFLKLLLIRNGMTPDDVPVLAVGNGATAVAAIRNKEVDGLSTSDPVVTELIQAGDVDVVLDTRTAEGLTAVYGGEYPSTCITASTEFIAENPNTVQAMANAIVKALRWAQTATADDMIKVLPAEVVGNNPDLYREVLARSLTMVSPDGIISEEGAANVLAAMKEILTDVDFSKIDVSKAYDNSFAQRANDALK